MIESADYFLGFFLPFRSTSATSPSEILAVSPVSTLAAGRARSFCLRASYFDAHSGEHTPWGGGGSAAIRLPHSRHMRSRVKSALNTGAISVRKKAAHSSLLGSRAAKLPAA